MSRPHTGTRLTGPTGNNAFAYAERKRIDPEPQLRLPSLKTITTIADIALGTEPTFAELDDEGKVITYTGLQHIYQLSFCTDAGGCFPTVPVYIFDNHNYALYFWATQPGLRCMHIDQHSDLGIPTTSLVDESYSSLHDIAHYTTHVCNVGNFIRPAIDAGIISTCTRVKNQYDLEHIYLPKDEIQEGYILDIDLDFRATEMGTDLTKSMPLVQSLMKNASLITIASSPYFLDQQYALEILEKLFAK